MRVRERERLIDRTTGTARRLEGWARRAMRRALEDAPAVAHLAPPRRRMATHDSPHEPAE
eukprot:scaffold105390_cov72-Phaeocystis_antarctica.AAC.5